MRPLQKTDIGKPISWKLACRYSVDGGNKFPAEFE
jgi:hypothetical protein